jgi:hypothetical protein
MTTIRPATEPTANLRDDDAERVRGRLMAQSLKALLDGARGARDVLPHLAALEFALGQQGTAALPKVPPRWLLKICTQLSSLTLPADDPPLHDLIERLLDALQAHRPPRPAGSEASAETIPAPIVSEVSESVFATVSREQATTQPGLP